MKHVLGQSQYVSPPTLNLILMLTLNIRTLTLTLSLTLTLALTLTLDPQYFTQVAAQRIAKNE